MQFIVKLWVDFTDFCVLYVTFWNAIFVMMIFEFHKTIFFWEGICKFQLFLWKIYQPIPYFWKVPFVTGSICFWEIYKKTSVKLKILPDSRKSLYVMSKKESNSEKWRKIWLNIALKWLIFKSLFLHKNEYLTLKGNRSKQGFFCKFQFFCENCQKLPTDSSLLNVAFRALSSNVKINALTQFNSEKLRKNGKMD